MSRTEVDGGSQATVGRLARKSLYSLFFLLFAAHFRAAQGWKTKFSSIAAIFISSLIIDRGTCRLNGGL